MKYNSLQLARIQNPRSYSKYKSMLRRCTDPLAHNWPAYGGRGITVDPLWQGKDGFLNFVLVMGEAPVGMTLGRVDNSKGYGPDNCAWQTWHEQAKDRRKGGIPKDPTSLRQRAIAAGLPYLQVYMRVKRLGWTEEKALTTPLAARTKRVS